MTLPLCPNCSARENPQLIRQTDFFRLWECPNCRLLFKSIPDLDRRKSQELQDVVYDDLTERTETKIYRTIAKKRFSLLRQFIQCGNLLEIGCAAGEFLELAQNNSFSATGIDGSELYTKYASQNNLKVLRGRLEDFHFQNESFDVIAFFHLLEHLENPSSFLKQIYPLLKPGGFLFIITPNRNSFTDNLFASKNPIINQPDHLLFFSEPNLRTLLTKTGFDPFYIATKEYPHHLFASIKSVIGQQLHQRKPDYSASPRSTVSQTTPLKTNLKLRIIRQAPYILSSIFYLLLLPYRLLLERNGRGHELICLAKKVK